MPCYEYIEEATGRKVEHIVPIAKRDAVPGHKRIQVPPRVNMAGIAEDIHSMEYGVRRGLREIEEKMGTSELRRRMDKDMQPEKLKRVWAQN
ncbi:MAG TPA: hypothetical protein VG838_00495 [Opitutaceae bacterium]|nr:hypothetical protein [Opitutaceae bacterium]